VDETFEDIGNGELNEDGTIYEDGTYKLLYEESGSASRLRYGTNSIQTNGGDGSVTLDSRVNGNFVTNRFIVQEDLSAYNGSDDLELSFDWSDHGDEDHGEDVVEIRGSDTDSWIFIYDWKQNDIGNGIYQTVNNIDLDEIL
jgi:hypothetical protein